MRITLRLDPGVARLVEDAVHRERRPMRQIINDALRSALRSAAVPAHFTVAVHESAVLPGLDLAGFNRLASLLAEEATMKTASEPA